MGGLAAGESATKPRLAFTDGGAVLRTPGGDIRVRTAMLIAAHPDDETIGAGSRLRELGELTIVHVTDGAPKNMSDARRYGFSSREQYALARRRELESALASGGIDARRIQLNIPDQEAAHRMAELARAMAALLKDSRPDVILTHPYEGGHPDHDACALAVHAAARLACEPAIPVCEFTSYHAFDGAMRTAEFLGCAENVTTVPLTPEELIAKRRMLDCFRTQQAIVSLFRTDIERYRPAPHYDFHTPPHSGVLHYEWRDWGMTSSRFARLAAEALRELGPGGPA